MVEHLLQLHITGADIFVYIVLAQSNDRRNNFKSKNEEYSRENIEKVQSLPNTSKALAAGKISNSII